MGEAMFSVYDLIQLGLMLLACYCCKAYGYQKGMVETLEFFEEQGVIEIPTKQPMEKEEEH